MNYQTPPPVFYKNPGLAAVLSFFYMGLGQIYNGQIAKAIVFIIAYTISWILMLVVIGFITTPIMWVYGIWDAYSSAQKINADIAFRSGQGFNQGMPPQGPPVN
jgi:TM2 domain-containing membrane protein YozV